MRGAAAAMGALAGPFPERITPRAGVLGALRGTALVFIGSDPLRRIFEDPIVGFTALFITLRGLIGRFRPPADAPAGPVAIALGTVIAIGPGQSSFDVSSVGFRQPLPHVGDLAVGIRYLIANLSGPRAGAGADLQFRRDGERRRERRGRGRHLPRGPVPDDRRRGTLIGAPFSPFPTSVYIGPPAYGSTRMRSTSSAWGA